MSHDLEYSEIEESSFSSKQTQKQHKIQTINFYNYRVTILFTLMGFYFLIFSIVELVTNYQQSQYQFSMQCQSKTCTAQTNYISFTSGNSIYIFLKNSYLSQADISYNSLSNTKKTNYITNSQMGKTISLTNSILSSNASAYPNGQFLSYFPQSTLSITEKSSQSSLTIVVGDLSTYKPTIYNKNDLSKQWANLQSQRFAVWEEQQITYGIKKKWGMITTSLSGNYTITLTSTNDLPTEFKNGISVFLTDGGALDGKNLPLCIISFIFSTVSFIFSTLSFIFGFGMNEKVQKSKIVETDEQI